MSSECVLILLGTLRTFSVPNYLRLFTCNSRKTSHNETNHHRRCSSGCPSVGWTHCALSCSLHCSYFTGDIFCVDERLQDEAIQQGRTPETLAEEEVKQSIKHSCENLSHAYCCVLGRYIRAVCGVLN